MWTLARLNRNIRSLGRYRDILGILIKYGFGHIVEQLNIDYYLELGKRLVTWDKTPKAIEKLDPQVRLRMALEELGPTFIKLGQLLSTRPDLIPRSFADEFRKLQDHVPAHDWYTMQKHLEGELGCSLQEAFHYIDPNPVAAASIAQVYRGILPEGEEVAIKIRRPGIEKIIETDLDILESFAYLLERHQQGNGIYDPVGIVREIRRSLYRELDMAREGHTTNRFYDNFNASEHTYIPKVYWSHSSEAVLTLEWIQGVRPTDAQQLSSQGIDIHSFMSNATHSFLEQVLVFGFFHADPHPGNLLALPDNRAAFLDFGMIGRLEEDVKSQFVDLMHAVVNKDVERLVDRLLFNGDLEENTVMKELRRDLSEFMDDYYDIPLQDIQTGKMLNEFVDLLSRHHIRFPSDLVLLGKALVTLEGVGRELDPQFNIANELQPFISKLVKEKSSPRTFWQEFQRAGRGYNALAKTLPRDIKEILNRINRNRFKIDLEHRGLGKLISDLDKASNRLSFSLIIGALIVGSSLIMQIEKGPQLFGFPLLGLLGYTVAGILGLWLAIAILRSGRL